MAEVEFRRGNLDGATGFARDRPAIVDKLVEPAAGAGVLSTIAQIGAMSGSLAKATTAASEAFDIYDGLGCSVRRDAAASRNRPERLCMTGMELGRALADHGGIDTELAVLRRAANGAHRLNRTNGARRADRMIRRLLRADSVGYDWQLGPEGWVA